MSSTNEQQKYRQLAMFSTIVAEVVVTPCLFGGITYYLTRARQQQALFSGIAALVGLVFAFYRIYLLNQKWSKDDRESNRE